MTETTKTTPAAPERSSEPVKKPEVTPDAVSLALARNPRLVVHKPRGQGFIIGQR
jgi:hypothetical protein